MIEVEERLRPLNVEELCSVPPTLTTYKREQTVFNEDICRELKELKCVLGCLEACVPTETRKAIQLFKRAAGAPGGSSVDIPATPVEMELEGKIAILREEVQKLLS